MSLEADDKWWKRGIKPFALIINVHHFAYVSNIVSAVIFNTRRSALCAQCFKHKNTNDDERWCLLCFNTFSLINYHQPMVHCLEIDRTQKRQRGHRWEGRNDFFSLPKRRTNHSQGQKMFHWNIFYTSLGCHTCWPFCPLSRVGATGWKEETKTSFKGGLLYVSASSLRGTLVKIFVPFISSYYVWLCWLHKICTTVPAPDF